MVFEGMNEGKARCVICLCSIYTYNHTVDSIDFANVYYIYMTNK
jgi:hypothetical protein